MNADKVSIKEETYKNTARHEDAVLAGVSADSVVHSCSASARKLPPNAYSGMPCIIISMCVFSYNNNLKCVAIILLSLISRFSKNMNSIHYL